MTWFESRHLQIWRDSTHFICKNDLTRLTTSANMTWLKSHTWHVSFTRVTTFANMTWLDSLHFRIVTRITSSLQMKCELSHVIFADEVSGVTSYLRVTWFESRVSWLESRHLCTWSVSWVTLYLQIKWFASVPWLECKRIVTRITSSTNMTCLNSRMRHVSFTHVTTFANMTWLKSRHSQIWCDSTHFIRKCVVTRLVNMTWLKSHTRHVSFTRVASFANMTWLKSRHTQIWRDSTHFICKYDVA